jgi:hypothetical protein
MAAIPLRDFYSSVAPRNAIFDTAVAAGTPVSLYHSAGNMRAKVSYDPTITGVSNQLSSAVSTLAQSGSENGVSNGGCSVAFVGPNTLLAYWRDSVNTFHARAGTTDAGNNITWGTEVTAAGFSTEMIQLLTMPRTGGGKAVMLLQSDGSGGAVNNASVLTVSGTVPTIPTTRYPFSPSLTNGSPSLRGCEVGVNQFCYVAAAAGSTGAQIQVGTITGTTISWGTAFSFTIQSGTTSYADLDVCVLSFTATTCKVLVSYGGAANSLAVRVFNIDNTSGAVTAPVGGVIVSSALSADINARLCLLDTDRALILYGNSTNTTILGRLITVSGNTPSLAGTETSIQGVTTLNNNMWATAKIAANQIVMTYSAGGTADTDTMNFRPIQVSGTTINVGAATSITGSAASTNYTLGRVTSWDGAQFAIGWNRAATFSPTYQQNVYIAKLGGFPTDNRSEFFGVSLAAVSAGATGSVAVKGTIASPLSGLNAGADYYISTTNTLTTTNTGFRVGKAVSATELALF